MTALVPAHEWLINDAPVRGIEIERVGFMRYAEIATEIANAVSEHSDFTPAFRNALFQERITAVLDDVRVRPSIDEIRAMPVPLYWQLAAFLRRPAEGAPVGKITKGGDAVNQAIHYALGTPVQFADEQGRMARTSSLIFKTSKHRDIEYVLGTSNHLQRAAMFIRLAAKMTDGKRLPEDALAELTVEDGNFIAHTLIKDFLRIADKIDDQVARIRFHSSGVDDLSDLEYPILFNRMSKFKKAFDENLKIDIQLAGGKV